MDQQFEQRASEVPDRYRIITLREEEVPRFVDALRLVVSAYRDSTQKLAVLQLARMIEAAPIHWDQFPSEDEYDEPDVDDWTPPDVGPPGSGAIITEYTGFEPGLEDPW
jgi:hypothetical protein